MLSHLRAFEPQVIVELESERAELRAPARDRRGARGDALRCDGPAGEAEAALKRDFDELTAFLLAHLVHEEAGALPARQAHLAGDPAAAVERIGVICPLTVGLILQRSRHEL